MEWYSHVNYNMLSFVHVCRFILLSIICICTDYFVFSVSDLFCFASALCIVLCVLLLHSFPTPTKAMWNILICTICNMWNKISYLWIIFVTWIGHSKFCLDNTSITRAHFLFFFDLKLYFQVNEPFTHSHWQSNDVLYLFLSSFHTVYIVVRGCSNV